MKNLILYIAIHFLVINLGVLDSKPLILPDTVFIEPAYYNSNFEGLINYEFFEVKVDNKTGVEIINAMPKNIENLYLLGDSSFVSVNPIYKLGWNGNIILEDKSIIKYKVSAGFKSPQRDIYSNTIFIFSYKTAEEGFTEDTVHFIVKRVNRDISTRNKKLTYNNYCYYDNSIQDILDIGIRINSTLFNGSSENIIVDSVKVRTDLDFVTHGFLNTLSKKSDENFLDIDFPYTLNQGVLTLDFSVFNYLMTEKSIVNVDYYTNTGVITDTTTILFSNIKGITAKSKPLDIVSYEYEIVESKNNVLKFCSEEGYIIADVNITQEFEEDKIELIEYVAIGDTLKETGVHLLSKLKIEPTMIPYQRSGTVVYNLYSISSGEEIKVDFPYNIKIELTGNVNIDDKVKYIVYPNPSNDHINIEGDFKIISTEIYDLLGNIVLSSKDSNKISLNNLNKGVYLIKIYTDLGIISEKVIKN